MGQCYTSSNSTTAIVHTHSSMKSTISLAVLARTALSQSGDQPWTAWNQQGIYFEKNFDWANMGADLIAAAASGYNRVYVGFYMSLFGCQGACYQWSNVMSSAEKQEVLAAMESYDSKLYLSVGGPTEYVENDWELNNTYTFGEAAARWAKHHMFEGIDFNVHLAGGPSTRSEFALSGNMTAYAMELVKAAKDNGYDRSQLTITGEAAYFSNLYVEGNEEATLAWPALDRNENEDFSVQDIHLMMFNEEQDYMSYDDMFIKNTYFDEYFGVTGLGSAVQEIIDQGISENKVAFVKPISESESTVTSGYIDPDTLKDWACDANQQVLDQYGSRWAGGFVIWTWNSYDDMSYQWPAAMQCL